MKSWVGSLTVLALLSFLLLITLLQRHESDVAVRLRPPLALAAERLFYVYDWPQEVVDAVPKSYSHHRLSILPDFLLNDGAGRVINTKKGMYHTHQYALFPLVYHRLLTSPHRTLNPEEASLFFIPYDLGMDSSTRSSDGALFKTNCPRLDRVMTLLQSSPYFQRHSGKDHFFLHSINHMMTYYANQQCTRLYQTCFNCTKLSIDVYSSSLYPSLASERHMTHNWISIPFPSDYHYSSSASEAPWKTLIDPVAQSNQYRSERPYLLSFVGSAQVTAKKQRDLRLALISECSELNRVDPHHCLLVNLESHESMTPHYLNGSTVSAAIGTGSSGSESEVNPYSISRLCLMPGGDFPTRKGFLDAMLSGCVPVTFQLIAAQEQWPLHWMNRETALRCTVFVERDSVMSDVKSALKQLVAVSEDLPLLSEKRKCIASVAHRFQYSLPSFSRQNSAEEDALDVILNHLLKI